MARRHGACRAIPCAGSQSGGGSNAVSLSFVRGRLPAVRNQSCGSLSRPPSASAQIMVNVMSNMTITPLDWVLLCGGARVCLHEPEHALHQRSVLGVVYAMMFVKVRHRFHSGFERGGPVA